MNTPETYFRTIGLLDEISVFLDGWALSPVSGEPTDGINALSELKEAIDFFLSVLKQRSKGVVYITEEEVLACFPEKKKQFAEKPLTQPARPQAETAASDSIKIPTSTASLLSVEYMLKILHLGARRKELIDAPEKEQANSVFLDELTECICALFLFQKKKIILTRFLHAQEGLSFLDIGSGELGRQFILIEADLFEQIDPSEVVADTEEVLCQGLVSFREYLQYTEKWVLREILKHRTLVVIEKAIGLACFLLENGGLNTCRAILDVLSSETVFTLRASSEVSLRYRAQYRNAKSVMSPDNNFQKLRGILEQRRIWPYVPVLETYRSSVRDGKDREDVKSDFLVLQQSSFSHIASDILVQHWILTRPIKPKEEPKKPKEEPQKRKTQPKTQAEKEEIVKEMKKEREYDAMKFVGELETQRRTHSLYER
ncbi:MAG: uncharacterized protein A8A55_1736 [Amphiamblys sp. WSBS2006]|nr:MAG: uncharacterized protein A8A55_1736 [Amphiamblys sp. WSBS2006]